MAWLGCKMYSPVKRCVSSKTLKYADDKRLKWADVTVVFVVVVLVVELAHISTCNTHSMMYNLITFFFSLSVFYVWTSTYYWNRMLQGFEFAILLYPPTTNKPNHLYFVRLHWNAACKMQTFVGFKQIIPNVVHNFFVSFQIHYYLYAVFVPMFYPLHTFDMHSVWYIAFCHKFIFITSNDFHIHIL